MNQVSTIDQSSMKTLVASLGAGTGANDNIPQVNMPSIRMNQEAMIGTGRDAEKNPFFGCFFLKTEDPEDYVYGESMIIRPLSNVFQYTHMDFDRPSGEQCINKTVQISSWDQEPRDEKGTLRCGKPTSKEMEGWSKEERGKYKDIVCTRIIRCVATYTGKKANGEEVTVENHPAIIWHAKNHYRDFEDQVIRKIPRNANIFDYEVELVPNFGTGQAGNQYANFTFKPILKRLEMTEEVFETLKVIKDIIDTSNARIEKSYTDAIRARQVDQAALDAMSTSAQEDYDGGTAH